LLNVPANLPHDRNLHMSNSNSRWFGSSCDHHVIITMGSSDYHHWHISNPVGYGLNVELTVDHERAAALQILMYSVQN
jgi:hypothetical protein